MADIGIRDYTVLIYESFDFVPTELRGTVLCLGGKSCIFSRKKHKKLSAVLEMEGSLSIAEIIELIDELDNLDLLPDVHDDEALGEYYADCGCIFANVPDHIQRYFDYESYGKDIRLESSCCFTSYGLVMDNR